MKFRTWDWLPRPLRSLQWYDQYVFGRISCSCCNKTKQKILIAKPNEISIDHPIEMI